MLESISNKFAGLHACNFVKKRLQHRCFAVNIVKLLRTAFFMEHRRWLFLWEVLFIDEKCVFSLLNLEIVHRTSGRLVWYGGP